MESATLSTRLAPSGARPPAPGKCLVLELWHIGDATMMTPVLEGLLAEGWQVTVAGKATTRLLLEEDYPEVRWIVFDAPWTVFYGKYRLWRWPWRELWRVWSTMRRERFDVAVSGRSDPRDHLMMWLAGIRRRIGFQTRYSLWFLNEPLPPPPAARHRVEDWWTIQQQVSPAAPTLPPRLGADAELKGRFGELFARDPRPVLALHCGARIAVRRWPEPYLRELIAALRAEFDFQLVLYPDVDGYGQYLAALADHVLTGLTLGELKASLIHARLLIANDSGLGHVAAALGVPVATIFGTGEPSKFRPFSQESLVIMRDICPYRPCLDYCHFPEAYCLTQLSPAIVLRELRAHLQAHPLFPSRRETSLGIAPPGR
jgi:ADP-heptose:LPS heptosyltransferase